MVSIFKIGDKVKVNKYMVENPVLGSIFWVDGMDSCQGKVYEVSKVYPDKIPVRYLLKDKKFYFVEDWLEPVEKISIDDVEKLNGIENGHGLRIRATVEGGIDVIDPNGCLLKNYMILDESTAKSLNWCGFKVKFDLDLEKFEKEVMDEFVRVPWKKKKYNWCVLCWGDGEYLATSTVAKTLGASYFSKEDAEKIANELNTRMPKDIIND